MGLDFLVLLFSIIYLIGYIINDIDAKWNWNLSKSEF